MISIDTSINKLYDDAFKEELCDLAAVGPVGVMTLLNPRTGEIISRRNKFLYRGLIFLMEQFTNTFIPMDIRPAEYIRDHARIPVGLRIGTGGSLGGEAIVVDEAETGLASPVPFRQINTSLGETLTAAERLMYFDAVVTSNITSYYGKRFSDQSWEFDPITKLIGVKFTTNITRDEANGNFISELGAVIGAVADDGLNPPVISNIEQITRVTYPTGNNVTDVVVGIYGIYLMNPKPTNV